MYIKISDLTFRTIIGILPFERIKPQKIIVNFECEYEYKNENFVDYSKICSFIKEKMRENKFYLIEEAIIFLCENLESKFEISNIKLEIKKPDIMSNCIVSIKN